LTEGAKKKQEKKRVPPARMTSRKSLVGGEVVLGAAGGKKGEKTHGEKIGEAQLNRIPRARRKNFRDAKSGEKIGEEKKKSQSNPCLSLSVLQAKKERGPTKHALRAQPMREKFSAEKGRGEGRKGQYNAAGKKGVGWRRGGEVSLVLSPGTVLLGGEGNNMKRKSLKSGNEDRQTSA